MNNICYLCEKGKISDSYVWKMEFVNKIIYFSVKVLLEELSRSFKITINICKYCYKCRKYILQFLSVLFFFIISVYNETVFTHWRLTWILCIFTLLILISMFLFIYKHVLLYLIFCIIQIRQNKINDKENNIPKYFVYTNWFTFLVLVDSLINQCQKFSLYVVSPWISKWHNVSE